MPREYEDLKNRYEKRRERFYRDLDAAKIDNDTEGLVRAAEAFSQNVIDSVLAFEDAGW